MLLLVALTLVDFASSHSTEMICYGNSYEVPYQYTPLFFDSPLYYQQRNKPRIVVVSEGKSNHKRFVVSPVSRPVKVTLKALTEQDQGATLFFGQSNSVTFNVRDCQDPQVNTYGEVFSWRVPYGAEYLEFSQIDSQGIAQTPLVIWNRTDSSIGRGTVKRNYYEFLNLKQKDNGYYKFIGKYGDMIKWKRIQVKEHIRHYERKEGDHFDMNFPVKFTVNRVTCTAPGADDEYPDVLKDHHMRSRMEITNYDFTFFDLQPEDTGTYKFLDDEGFTVVVVELQVNHSVPTWTYIVGVVIIFLCIFICCCCVKKCCCKKSSSKRNNPTTEAAAAATPVFYHGAAQPAVPLLESEPRAVTRDPPAYRAVTDHTNRPQPTQVTVPEGPGQTSTPMIPPSSDSDPRFEFKGSLFPSAPPLSCGTSIKDVYTSDKLNFL